MENMYSLLTSLSPLPIGEEKKLLTYQHITERHLQAMWLEQKYFTNLRSPTGELISVFSPGIWNGEAGPDFLKAHLKIGNQEIRGDIEIHLDEESWYQHQHHMDKRYNEVILHISLWKPKNPKPILNQDGEQILCTYLEDSLTISLTRILKLIDLDLYPYKHFLGSGKCAQALFCNLPEKKVIAFFKSAASWRLGQKRDYLKNKVDNPYLWFPVGIAMALGYRHNAEAFAELLFKLLNRKFQYEQTAIAFCLGSCGFFDPFYLEKWSHSEKYLELYKFFQKLSPCNIEPVKLSLHQTRPFNHPIRRLVYLVKMFMDPNLPHLYSKMIHHWENSYLTTPVSLLRKQFQEMIPQYEDAYWNHHYTFENVAKEGFLSLIGEDFKVTLLINTFLPLLQESVESGGNVEEIKTFEAFYGGFPVTKTGKFKYLTHRFFGETQKGALINRANLEQGLYQLHKDYCIHFEASCRGCPFIENYTTIFGQ